jgi:nucleoside-diphosphate-sugar epimerase
MTSQQRSISILGCGWLGKPLAEHFIGKKWRVLASTTSTEKIDVLEKSGIEAFQIVADGRSELNTPEFFESEILVINVPPVRSPDIEQLYPVQTKQIINAANQGKVRKLIFIGSTSVYAAQNQVADEMDKSSPDKASGKALLAAEKTVKDQ